MQSGQLVQLIMAISLSLSGRARFLVEWQMEDCPSLLVQVGQHRAFLLINGFRCYEAKIELTKLAVTRSRTQDTSGLNCQCSPTEPRQADNYQPSQSSMYIAQVILNDPCSRTPGSQSLGMCHQNSVRG